jgi:glucose/arabinose dehydrogenase
MTIFSRRQIETVVAAMLAAVTAIVGLSNRDEERLGPKFLALEKVGNFRQPVHIAQPPKSDLLFVVEKVGRIKVIDHGQEAARPFLDIRGRVKDDGKGDEQGLLSVAFAADYTESGRFYVAYTDRHDDLQVVEFRRSEQSDLRADRSSARRVLSIVQPSTKHHGGLLLFGPDGHLYIGSGDGGLSGDPNDTSQNPRLLLGKLLRIDPLPPTGAAKPRGKPKKGKAKPRPQYTVPKDNPFVGRPGRDEIYSYGLRNPWRFSFDRATGALTIGDVGDIGFEEVDYVTAGTGRGVNFGWSAYEGRQRYKGGVPRSQTVFPIYTYRHGPGCSVIGGYVVRDPRLTRIAGREIVGRYLFGDYCSGRLYAFRPRPEKAGKNRKLRFEIPALSSFGEDTSGRIYIVSKQGGVWRLVARRKRQ